MSRKAGAILQGLGQGLKQGLSIYQGLQDAPVERATKQAYLDLLKGKQAANDAKFPLTYSGAGVPPFALDYGGGGGDSLPFSQGGFGGLDKGVDWGAIQVPRPMPSQKPEATTPYMLNGILNQVPNSAMRGASAMTNNQMPQIDANQKFQLSNIKGMADSLVKMVGGTPGKFQVPPIPGAPTKASVFDNNLQAILNQANGVTPKAPAPQMNAKDIEAITWAKQNPDNPLAKQILQKWGM